MTSVVEYQRLSNLISSKKLSSEQLKFVKEKYISEINSKRRVESIGSLAELLRVLEKRDYLNYDKLDRLYEIAELIGWVIPHVSNNENVHMNGNIEQNVANLSIETVLPRFPKEPKQKIYQCIATDIGKKWADFARALHVPEGYIDKLDKQKDLVSRVYEILRYYEERCDPRTFRSGLLDALSDARRNDLRKKVQNIFDIHC